MAVRDLPREEWESYLDAVSKQLKATEAEVEVAGLNIGDQVEAEWIKCYGVSYDPKDDVVAVVLEGLDHMIYHPQKILVDEVDHKLLTIEIIDKNGLRHIINMKEELPLLPRE